MRLFIQMISLVISKYHMSYVALKLTSGIIKETTQYAAEGGFVDGNLVRFRYSQPQQIGGWTPYATGAASLDGVARSMFAWEALDGSSWLALGTNRRLYVSSGGVISDVTPIYSSGNMTDPFSTTSGSNVISVALTAHGFSSGDIVNFTGSTTVATVVITGEYSITVIDANDFSIIAATNANATLAAQGGTVAYQYLLPTGPSDQTVGYGWGAATWGLSDWGTARSSGGVPLDIGQWTFDHWGQDLLANRFGAGIYTWVKATGVSTPAALISQAPKTCNSILVTQDRFLIAYGCSDPGATTNFDPLSIKWSTQGDYTNWSPSLTNTAGFYRINTGNAILTAKYIGGNILVFTDVDLYAQQPLSAPLVFGFQQVGSGCGLIAKNAAVVQNGIAFWMGQSQFYTYQGGVQPITCTVLRYVFTNINRSQSEKIWGVVNSSFNEIWWFYPSAASTEVDSYVIYNYVEHWWSIGELVRTAGIDLSVAAPSNPLMVDASGQIWVQESGDLANTVNMASYLVTAPMDIEVGDQVAICNRVVPDFAFKTSGTNVNLTFTGTNYPASVEVFTKGPYTVSENTPKIDFRLRGRQIQMRVDGVNGYYQLGSVRISLDPDGMR